jgi:hypothetical protein
MRARLNVRAEWTGLWKHLILEVLTVVKMSNVVLWVVTPCGLEGGYQRFGGTYDFRLQDT